MSDRRAFALAPMSGLIRALTVFLLAVPAVLALVAVATRQPLPLFAVAALMILGYGAVWLWWRPRGFEVSESAFDIVSSSGAAPTRS